MTRELAAIRSVDLDWTRHLQSVWDDDAFNVPELNGAIADNLIDYALACDRPSGKSPLGRAIIGAAGAGKTHLVGELRRRIWDKGGWFVLLDLADVNDFWATAALSYLQSLQHNFRDGVRQGDEILLKLCANTPSVRSVLKSKFKVIFSGGGKEIVELAKAIVGALRSVYPIETQKYQSVIRAFVLFNARDPDASDAAYSWLQGVDVEGNLFGPAARPRDVIRGLSWLMSLTGPTLLVVDQIDAIVAVHNHAFDLENGTDEVEDRKALKIIDELAGGLMDLRDLTLRTVTVLSSLEATWEVLQKRALAPAADRFRDPDYLRPINDGMAAERLVSARLGKAYQTQGFAAPYPTWPFRIKAFENTIGMLPRSLLKRCDAHIRKCLANGQVSELHSFEASEIRAEPPPVTAPQIEVLYQKLCTEVSPGVLQTQDAAEKLLPDLLLDALRCYVLQEDVPDDVDLAVESDPNRRRPALHARLRRIFRSEGDREVHHCFRAIPHANAVAFQSRLRAAMTASGIDLALPFRHLTIIRGTPPPSGPKTRQLCDEFTKAGGKFVVLNEQDLRTLLALQVMLNKRAEDFEGWLKQRKPLNDIALFYEMDAGGPPSGGPPKRAKHSVTTGLDSQTRVLAGERGSVQMATASTGEAQPDNTPKAKTKTQPLGIPIGHRLIGGQAEQPRSLALNLLSRHTAILAGSGSGKTVLLRRIVEEAALQGVPSIVLDTNNDLARLGDVWPETPAQWGSADQDKAQGYSSKVDVVVWTPGIAGGNPIMLAPMPAFGPLRGDEDELQQTVLMAHAALKPLIGTAGAKAVLKEGVLMQALRYFARSGSEGLDAFVRLLANLPAEVSDIDNANKLAAEMANLIKAEIAKNPLLSFKGTPLDPKVLFSSRETGKTRISVINFSGLPTDDAKQSFVNQLEMALFSWIKKNPSPPDRPLAGLFVLDEAQNFAPSQKNTPCKESTLALVAQARKYGLGMIFATQVPKNIDNKIVSNCTTHFYGKMNSPATIEAVRELMAAKGGGGTDIASMRAGEFYFATEGMTMAEKVKTPLCLSYHPQSPLSQEDVVIRARQSMLSSV